MRHMRNLREYDWAFGDPGYCRRTLDRIAERSSPAPNGCIIIGGFKDEKGYARVWFAGTTWLAHRLVWLLTKGEIGELVIDHKCRNPACVNLDHLDPVPNRENVMRGNSAYGGDVCPQGHAIKRGGRGRGCPACHAEKKRAKYHADPRRLEKNKERYARRKAGMAA